jgi:monofunctional biosynthetic peptidoglycan transglycosylase
MAWGKSSKAQPGSRWRRIGRRLVQAAVAFFGISLVMVVLYGFMPVFVTPLMILRLFEGEGISKDWVSYDNISPDVFRAVVAAEDNLYCQHYGFDVDAILGAFKKNQKGKRIYGGSTISQQTAKNVFLWPGSNIVTRGLRKGFEAYFTPLQELFWGKRRILEVYVNVIEWGHGVYGVEAAAQFHFKKSAAELTKREAALLAAVLPNPRRWAAGKPTGYISRRANSILRRMDQLPAQADPTCPVGPIEDKDK